MKFLIPLYLATRSTTHEDIHIVLISTQSIQVLLTSPDESPHIHEEENSDSSPTKYRYTSLPLPRIPKCEQKSSTAPRIAERTTCGQTDNLTYMISQSTSRTLLFLVPMFPICLENNRLTISSPINLLYCIHKPLCHLHPILLLTYIPHHITRNTPSIP
jgi:hypothetical protein